MQDRHDSSLAAHGSGGEGADQGEVPGDDRARDHEHHVDQSISAETSAETLPAELFEWFQAPSWWRSRLWLADRLEQCPRDTAQIFFAFAAQARHGGNDGAAMMLETHGRLYLWACTHGVDPAYHIFIGSPAFRAPPDESTGDGGAAAIEQVSVHASFQELVTLAQHNADPARQVALGDDLLRRDHGRWLIAPGIHMVQGILGNALLAMATGDRAMDRDRLAHEALQRYETAAQVQPRGAAPLAWSAAQHSRGQAFMVLAGEQVGMRRTRWLWRALAAFDLGLLEHRRPVAPLGWAMSQSSRSAALRELATVCSGVLRERLLRQALASTDLALLERRRAVVPRQWALTQNSRGIAFRELAAGQGGQQREHALRAAVAAFDLVLLEQHRESLPLEWAKAQNNRSHALIALAEGQTGNQRERMLQHAVIAGELALLESRRENAPLDWASALSNVGHALNVIGQHRGGDARTHILRRAVAELALSLLEYRREMTPRAWAMTQNNRGNALCDLAHTQSGSERQRSLQHATVALHLALLERQRAGSPLDWAATRSNRANVLRDRASELDGAERDHVLRQALADCDLALLEHQRAIAPRAWASTQNSRGAILRDLAEGYAGAERERVLRHAVAALNLALREYRRDVTPRDWAMTQNNKGAVLSALGEMYSGAQAERTQWQALAAYDLALLDRQREFVPLDWASTQSNRGATLIALASAFGGQERQVLLRRAIAAFDLALLERRRTVTPLEWAMTENNKGNALRDLASDLRDSGASQRDRQSVLQQAIVAYELALLERRRDVVPFEWAGTHNNRANALRDLANTQSGNDRARSLRQAAAAYRVSAEVYRLMAFPRAHRRVMKMLAETWLALALDLPKDQQGAALDRAWRAIDSGIQATEILELRAPSRGYREAEWAESAALYSHAAGIQACRGYMAEAVWLLETGRARGLMEAQTRRGVDLARLTDGEQATYLDALAAVTALEATERQAVDPFLLAERAHDANARLAALAQEYAQRYPGFLPERALMASQIAPRLRPGETLIYLQPLEVGCLVLALPYTAGEVRAETLHASVLVELTASELFHLVAQRNPQGRYRAGYLPASMGWGETPLIAALDELLPMLGDRLMRATMALAKELGAQRVVLAPGGILKLLPLHAGAYVPLGDEAATAPGGRRYACDDCAITYTPSGGTLVAARVQAQRQRESAEHPGGGLPTARRQGVVVGNPQLSGQGRAWGPGMRGYLPYAAGEARRAGQLLAAAGYQITQLIGAQATRDAMLACLRRSHVAHLALHADFNLEAPQRSAFRIAFNDRLRLADLLDERIFPPLTQMRLAILSACQTAQSDFQRLSEESVGMLGGFLTAGVPGVIGSLWPVYDRSTSLLMESVWRAYLQDGQEPDAALHTAQRALRDGSLRGEAADHADCNVASRPSDAPEPDATATTAVGAFGDLRDRHDLLHQFERGSAEERLATEAFLATVTHPVHWAAFVYYGA